MKYLEGEKLLGAFSLYRPNLTVVSRDRSILATGIADEAETVERIKVHRSEIERNCFAKLGDFKFTIKGKQPFNRPISTVERITAFSLRTPARNTLPPIKHAHGMRFNIHERAKKASRRR